MLTSTLISILNITILNPASKPSSTSTNDSNSSWKRDLSQIHTAAETDLQTKANELKSGSAKASFLLKNELFKICRQLYYRLPAESFTLKALVVTLNQVLDKFAKEKESILAKYGNLNITKVDLRMAISSLKALLTGTYKKAVHTDIEFSKLITEFNKNGKDAGLLKSLPPGAKGLLLEILGLFAEPHHKTSFTASFKAQTSDPEKLKEIETIFSSRKGSETKILPEKLNAINDSALLKTTIINAALKEIFSRPNSQTMRLEEFQHELTKYVDEVNEGLDKSRKGLGGKVRGAITNMFKVITRQCGRSNLSLSQLLLSREIQSKLRKNDCWSNGGGDARLLCNQILDLFSGNCLK